MCVVARRFSPRLLYIWKLQMSTVRALMMWKADLNNLIQKRKKRRRKKKKRGMLTVHAECSSMEIKVVFNMGEASVVNHCCRSTVTSLVMFKALCLTQGLL